MLECLLVCLGKGLTPPQKKHKRLEHELDGSTFRFLEVWEVPRRKRWRKENRGGEVWENLVFPSFHFFFFGRRVSSWSWQGCHSVGETGTENHPKKYLVHFHVLETKKATLGFLDWWEECPGESCGEGGVGWVRASMCAWFFVSLLSLLSVFSLLSVSSLSCPVGLSCVSPNSYLANPQQRERIWHNLGT